MQQNWVGGALPQHTVKLRLHGAARWQLTWSSASYRQAVLAAHAQCSGIVALPGVLAAHPSVRLAS